MLGHETASSCEPNSSSKPGRFQDDLLLALKARRERAGLSCAGLGRLAGLGVSYVSQMECGHVNVQIGTILRLVDKIDCRYPLDPRATLKLKYLAEIVGDLRGWVKDTSELLKHGWLTPTIPSKRTTRPRSQRRRTDLDGGNMSPEGEGRSRVDDKPDFTFSTLLRIAEQKLGSKKAVRERLRISAHRLRDAAVGGPPIRAERVVLLALCAGVEPTDALRAGGHEWLASLLEEAYLARLTSTTPEQAEWLTNLGRLSVDMQGHVRGMVRALAAHTGGAPDTSSPEVSVGKPGASE
jgi:transcriptional regulator with XRE-family HTH domain